MLIVIGLGLLVRSPMISLPVFFSKYLGDALWAMVVFLGLAILFRDARTIVLALCAMGISTLVELSQLYHDAWIDSVRKTIFGRLVLGNIFHWPDLIAYGLGILVIALIDEVMIYRVIKIPPTERSSAGL